MMYKGFGNWTLWASWRANPDLSKDEKRAVEILERLYNGERYEIPLPFRMDASKLVVRKLFESTERRLGRNPDMNKSKYFKAMRELIQNVFARELTASGIEDFHLMP